LPGTSGAVGDDRLDRGNRTPASTPR
jgi:hypothetical protein